jgi:hypothetical protein
MNSDVVNVDVFGLACTVKKLFDIFGCVRNLAVNLSLKQTFVILTHAMTPSISFYYCTLCILPRCAFELSSVVILFSCAEIHP